VEILGEVPAKYLVRFVDAETDETVHEGVIENNQWIRTARTYFTDWQVNVYSQADGSLQIAHRYDCAERRVYIAFESRALGDTLAWFPAVEEFRKAHGCRLICSTFMNDLFREQYPEIEFAEPGTTVPNLYAMYRIGWFYTEGGEIDYTRNPRNFRETTLGRTAFDVLGLNYEEIRPRLAPVPSSRPMTDEYVCIGVHATAQAKYWNNRSGWAEVVKFLDAKGYRVVLLSREGAEYMGNRVPGGVIELPPGPVENLVNYLAHARMYIGIGSGLSWLSWAVGCRTCLISGFSYPYTEMRDCIRIFPETSACAGCFNRYRLVADDWNWCPDQHHTGRMFECSREIGAKQVIDAIEAYL
jgi:autotransporter strand-loop-strand O-heptosyltransferase